MQFILCLLGFILVNPSDRDKQVQSYIRYHGPIAVAEMHRTGIPASIKLAQAIVESRYGTSKLSRNSNNHFGIKCKDYWKGKTYFHVDDDRNADGQLIKSCFRAYDDVMDSFIDHSNFLTKSFTYDPLFKIPHTEYRHWAHGLQGLGYASDKSYADKLINTIETYELFHWDRL